MTNAQFGAALVVLCILAVSPWRAWLRRSAAAAPCRDGYFEAVDADGTEHVACLDAVSRPRGRCTDDLATAPLAGERWRMDVHGCPSLALGPMSASRRLAVGVALDPNTDTAAALATVPGLGMRLAERIVAARPYDTLEELERVRGIGPKKRAALSPWLRVRRPRRMASGRGRRRRWGRGRRLSSLLELLEAGELRDDLQVLVHRLLVQLRVIDVRGDLALEDRRLPRPTLENEFIGFACLAGDGCVIPVERRPALGGQAVREARRRVEEIEATREKCGEQRLGRLGVERPGRITRPRRHAMRVGVLGGDRRRLRRQRFVEFLEECTRLVRARVEDGGRVLLDDGVAQPVKRSVRRGRVEVLLAPRRGEERDENEVQAGAFRHGEAFNGGPAPDVNAKAARGRRRPGGRVLRTAGGVGRMRRLRCPRSVRPSGLRFAQPKVRGPRLGGDGVTLQTENTPGVAGVPAATSPQPEFVRLKQGDTVGSRFVVDERLRDDVIGPIYRAVDEKSGRKIVIVMLDGVLATDRASTDELRTSIKVTAGLAHKNLVSVFGLGRENKRRYIAREFVDGQTLSELLEKKSEAGKCFTLKGAYNLVAHVCNALQYALPHLAHGTLRPGNVLINRTGRVKVADFGLGALRSGLVDRRAALGRWDAICFPRAAAGAAPAPAGPAAADDAHEADLNIEGALDALEASPGAPVAGSASATRFAADDLFALGAILYALLAGRPLDPDAPAVAPDVARRLPEGLEKVLVRCWGGDGVTRFRDPNELKTELLHIIEANRGSERDGEGDALRPESSIVSLDDSPSLAPAPAAPPPPRAPAAKPGPGKAAPRAARKRPEPAVDGGGFVIPELRPAGVVEDDGTTQRWLVEKQGVDYGPFTSKQIIEKLFGEEIVADTNLYDIETDKRLALSEHAVFDDALVSWVHEKAERDKRRAEEAREAADRRRTRMFMSVGMGLLLIVGGLGGGFAWYQSTLPKPEKAHLAGLVAKWTGALPQILLPDEAPETAAEVAERAKTRQVDASMKRARDEARKMAEEERLAATSELDGTSPGGGTGRTFDQGAMNALVAERNPQIIKCLQEEIRRDPGRRNFEIKATILPRGDVINVRMEGGTPSGNSCVRGALGSLKVPPFDGTNQTLRLPFNIN